jgi:hypothetical protein
MLSSSTKLVANTNRMRDSITSRISPSPGMNTSKALNANGYRGRDRHLFRGSTLVLVLSRAATVLVIVIETGRDGPAIHRS